MKRLIAILCLLLCLTTMTVSSLANTDKDELGALLNENLDPSLYTHESYQIYQDAVDQGLYIYETAGSTAENITTALNDLKTAKAGLAFALTRNILLDYIEKMDAFLYGTGHALDVETAEKVINARTEFETLYQSEELTPEMLTQAAEKYDAIVDLAESSGEVSSFSPETAPEDVVLPEGDKDVVGLNRIITVRLTIILIGAIALVLGIVAAILYLKPPKFLR